MNGGITFSNVAKVFLPIVVILQEAEKRSGIEREALSANAPFFTWGIVYSVALGLPIVTGGSRCDHKTESAEHVELAKSRILSPLDTLKLWFVLVGDTEVILGRGSR